MKYFKFLLMLVFAASLSFNVNASGKKVENLTAETTTAAGDELILTDVSASNDTNRITLTNFFVTVPVAITSSAVITGLTVEATGDTASDDNSAMGYTSTEGLILTGQGSTNDVTIKNDADADVLVIPTGTTNVDIVGDATASTFAPDGDTATADSAAIGYTSIEGIIITGQGSTNDVTIKNDADAIVAAIQTGTTNFDIVGVGTAATFEPDGDTSAGDNAAIGYTATEGLILTGQGSTNDLTFKNDADADVIVILTGTVNVDIVGVATATTFEPDGDTASDDNAAIGYTATEGIVITGQGSTNDVTIKNDADADVLVVPTGTTNVDVVGVLTAATMEPDGDTSTGDNASVGYTSTDGLILTGQGTTNDVTIKNDADTIVVAVLTGTTNLSMPAGTLVIADGGIVTQLTNKATGVTISKYSGQITTDNASLAAGDEVTFIVTNTVVTALDVVCISIASSPDADSEVIAYVNRVASGAFDIVLSNLSSNADTGAIVINFVVLRGASS